MGRTTAGRFRRDQRGSVSLEYMVWMPVFCLLLLTIVEVSLVLFSHARMWDVARDYGRRVAVGQIEPAAAATSARQSLTGLMTYTVDIDDTTQPGQIVVNIAATNPDIFFGVYALFSPRDGLQTTYTIRDER
ncbi:MAG: TadE/TadG family type IV pilus assembly protein [Pseudomonadota bacterium]